MKKLKTILQSRYLFKIICLVMLVYSLFLIIAFPFKSKYQGTETKITGILTQYKMEEEKVTIYLKDKETMIIYYYFENQEEYQQYQKKLKLGQIIQVTGTLKEPSNNTIPNLFNYKNYLKYKKIFYIMTTKSLKIVKNNTSIFYEIKNKIMERIDQIDNTGYLRTFILGDKTKLEKDTLNKYQENGISHLFSISGMHINLLTGILLFLLDKITYNNYYKYSIISIFPIFYLFLTGVSASILRTTVMFLVISINRCFNLKIKSLDIMLVTLIICLGINPYLLCDVGFQFSYFISMILVLKRETISKIKPKPLKSLYISYLCFLVSIPICLYHFGRLNILSIFLNLIMIPLVSIIIFPMTLIVFLIPNLFFIYEKLIYGMEQLNLIFSKINFLELILAKPNILVILVYSVVIAFILYQKKYLFLLIILLSIHKYYPNLDGKFLMTVLDVGQGDSIFIKLPYNQGNLLIDTGGIVSFDNQTEENSLSTQKIIPYLNSLGITQIDYLILTHGDYDHMGESTYFVENFKVKNVIFNKGEYNTLEKKLIDILEKKQIAYTKSSSSLKINKYNFFFLNQTIYEDENKNSNIIYFKYSNYQFLLLGDAYQENEEQILEKYKLEYIDFLKVGHHGSDTSTSQKFIEKISPRNSIISVGVNNRYGHPSNKVLKKLESSKIYRTDQDGSMVIEIKKNCRIKTYSPKEAVNSRNRICV